MTNSPLESHFAERIWKLSIPLLIINIDIVWMRIDATRAVASGYELAIHFWTRK